MELNDRNLAATPSEPTMETAALMHAGSVVRQFLVYLKANPVGDDRIVDIDNLPLPKASLINAFRLLIAGETRLEQRSQLQKVGLLLAQFQGEGDGAANSPTDDIEGDPLASWIDTVADEPATEGGSWLAVYREHERLTELFALSARMAERRGAGDDDGFAAEKSVAAQPH